MSAILRYQAKKDQSEVIERRVDFLGIYFSAKHSIKKAHHPEESEQWAF